MPSESLAGTRVFLFPEGLGKKRRELFAAQVERLGGRVAPHPRGATHLLLEGDEAPSGAPPGVQILSTRWLSECIKQQRRVPERDFLVAAESRSRGAAADGAEESSPAKVARTERPHALPRNDAAAQDQPCNQLLLSELKKLAQAYKNSGDKWRHFAYTKAISAIECHKKPITSYEEALALPGLGEKMAAKVFELLETGKLQRTEEICETEEAKTLALFNGVWGVGPTTAQQWFHQGLRTLEDLRTKASLTRQQQIGLKYYEEINQKIPRAEVEAITEIVTKAARGIEPDVWVETCGSYRRGRDLCGDIDIVLSLPEDSKLDPLLRQLVQSLKDQGCLTDDLSSGHSHKFLGICQASPESLHRRLDLFVVRWGERGCALVHYTGSAHFNRSLRRLALKKNWTLSDHALTGDCGKVIPTESEEDVFKALGVEYKTPEQREHALEVLSDDPAD